MNETYGYSHFIDEKTEAPRSYNLSKDKGPRLYNIVEFF